MENPNYEKYHGGAVHSQNPPPYSEKEPSVEGPASFAANPNMPYQYQPYFDSYGVPPGQRIVTQTMQNTTVVVPLQPTNEPDYLVYSIFTMLCCCLPLGIAALVYSIQTRDANHIGDSIAARRNSRMAQIFANTALGLGIVFIIIYIVLTTTVGF